MRQTDLEIAVQDMRLPATLYSPGPGYEPPLVVIFDGGSGRVWKRGDSMFLGHVRLAEALARDGLAVLTFDCRWKVDPALRQTRLSMADDLRAAIEFATANSCVSEQSWNPLRVGVFAVCSSASVASRVLVETGRVASFASYGGVLDWWEVLKQEGVFDHWRGHKASKGTPVDFDAERQYIQSGEYELVNNLPNLTQHVLIANGTRDIEPGYKYSFLDYATKVVGILGRMTRAKSAVFSLLHKGRHLVNYGDDSWHAYVGLVKGWFVTTL